MTTDSSVPLVYAIVLNHNGRQHLQYSLPSICATEYDNFRVLVVDNASTDDSLEIARAFPVETVSSRENLGWSGGNNLGIRRALENGASYVVLANNDIRVHPRWIAESVQLGEQQPDVGVVGFAVHEPVPDDADRDAGFSAACEQWHEPEVTASTCVGGMAMLVRTRAFEDLGLIDENFFAYGEENDFQIRARRGGYRVVTLNVPVWHFGQGSFGQIPVRASLLQIENNIQLLIKHQGIGALPLAAFKHVVRRCLPGRRTDTRSAVERRLSAGGAFRAAAITAVASCRIAARLPRIIRRQHEDDRRIISARNRRRSEEPHNLK